MDPRDQVVEQPFNNQYNYGVENIVCYGPTLIQVGSFWQGINPLQYSLPAFILQVILVLLTTRALVIVLRPFHQPRVIAEIIAGIILGPSVMGQIKNFGDTFFPQTSLLTLATMGHCGLLYFLFFVGVEMDITVIRRTGRKALAIAVAGMALPFIIGTSTSFILQPYTYHNVHQGSFLLFLGVTLSVTAFPVLARILAETKLVSSEIGHIAMSAAVVNDICAWILLAISIALSETKETLFSFLWILLSGVAFVLLCFFAVRPAIWWVVLRIPEGETVDEFYVCVILTGVMVAGLVTDAIGIHSVFGAFVFGLAIPNGPLGATLIEKLEDFLTGLLLPLFFVSSGLRTNLSKVHDPIGVCLLALVYLLASVGKVVGTILIALFYSMPFSEGMLLGFLMNTRGLMEMIILNIGRDKAVLDDESFAVFVLSSVVVTSLVTPVVTAVHRPWRRHIGYKRRNLQWAKHDAELRMLACIHNTGNVPSIISLLEVSNPTKSSPIFVYALHLVELTGRTSTMLIVHNSSTKPSRPDGAGRRQPHGSQAQSEHIIAAFESYEQHAGGVSVQPFTAVSPYTTMYEDICSLAEDKHVALVVLPFHKQQTVDGAMETTNPSIRLVNQNVLAAAPCSVAILVDRGLGGTARVACGQHVSHHVALLFFGGPDDREALAYAWRMVENPGISLTVVRFLLAEEAPGTTPTYDSRVITIVTDSDRERQLDDEYLNEFRIKNVGHEAVVYMEKLVCNSEETVAAIRSMDSIHDLYIVGKGHEEGAAAKLLAGMTEWTECPELGPIGDVLASSDFAMTTSVMVVQQYNGGEGANGGEGTAALESPGQYLNNAGQSDEAVAYQPRFLPKFL